MRCGTIFDRAGERAVIHRVPQAEVTTLCGVDLTAHLPSRWSERARWGLEPKAKQPWIRCKECYPHKRRRK